MDFYFPSRHERNIGLAGDLCWSVIKIWPGQGVGAMFGVAVEI
jgi:hypothetical protein